MELNEEEMRGLEIAKVYEDKYNELENTMIDDIMPDKMHTVILKKESAIMQVANSIYERFKQE